MKLHKLLVGGGIAFILAASLFLGACSNSSTDEDPETNPDNGTQQPGGTQETVVELTEGKFQSDGKCTITVQDGKLIVEHTERVDSWTGFRMKDAEALGTSLSFKVTNLGAGKAWVKVLVKKADGKTDQITHYKLGTGEKKAMPFSDNDKDGVPITLAKDASETITVWYTESPAKLVVLFDSNTWFEASAESETNKPVAGKIEISDMKYTSASTSSGSGDNNSGSGETGGSQGGEAGGEPPAVVEYEDYVTLDFTQLSDFTDNTVKTELAKIGLTVNYFGTDGTKDENKGLKRTISAAWSPIMNLQIADTDLTGAKIVFDWELENWNYGGQGKLLVKILSDKVQKTPDDDNSWEETKRSQASFAEGTGENVSKSGTAEILLKDFEHNPSDEPKTDSPADVTKIAGIQIVGNDSTAGTIYIKSFKIMKPKK